MLGQADEPDSANGYAPDVVFMSLTLMVKRWSMKSRSIEVMGDEEKEERRMRANTAPHCSRYRMAL